MSHFNHHISYSTGVDYSNMNDIEAPSLNLEERDAHKKIFDELDKKCDLKIDENTIIKTIKNCNSNDEIQSLENMVHELVNSKVEELPHYGPLRRLIDSKDEQSILELFDYCVKKCIEEEKLDLLCEVAIFLPDFINSSFYKCPVGKLMKKLTYVKVPSKWCEVIEHQSTNENLYGYKIHNPEPSKLDRLQTIPQHNSTLCYLPLPGLCSYPKDSSILNYLFPHKISPFAKFIITYPDEILRASHASSEIIDSPLFQAIVKFKWRAFARFRFLVIIGSYIFYFGLFVAAINTRWMLLQIISTFYGAFLTICITRYAIILFLNDAGTRFFSPTMFLTFGSILLPTATGLLEFFFDESRWLIIIRATSIGLLWIGIIESLIAFRRIGTFILVVAQVCREVLWLLIYLTLGVFSAAHGTVTYSRDILKLEIANGATPANDPDNLQKIQDFTGYSNALNAYWSGFLSDYSSWPANDIYLYVAKVTFSLFITVVILNIMIALVNSVYTDVLGRAYTEWSMVRAQMILIIELATMSPSDRQNRDYFPWTIFYKAFSEEVDHWHKKLEAKNIPISRNPIQMLDEMVCKMKDETAKIDENDNNKTKITDKLNELRQLLYYKN